MTTINHTPIATGAAANAAIINAPLSELDTKMGAAKTSGHIIYADASGNLAGAATLYRHPTSGNVIIGDSTPTDITGATLQVSGSLVISDGAGGTKLKLGSGGLIASRRQDATIASGEITATSSKIVLDTEGGAASDDLDTINGGEDGMILILSTNNSSRDVTIKHNTGNIYTAGSADRVLSANSQFIFLVYFSNLPKWVEIGRV